MKNISTFNKIFLLFCAALFIFLAIKAPHEGENAVKQKHEKVKSTE